MKREKGRAVGGGRWSVGGKGKGKGGETERWCGYLERERHEDLTNKCRAIGSMTEN